MEQLIERRFCCKLSASAYASLATDAGAYRSLAGDAVEVLEHNGAHFVAVMPGRACGAALLDKIAIVAADWCACSRTRCGAAGQFRSSGALAPC